LHADRVEYRRDATDRVPAGESHTTFPSRVPLAVVYAAHQCTERVCTGVIRLKGATVRETPPQAHQGQEAYLEVSSPEQVGTAPPSAPCSLGPSPFPLPRPLPFPFQAHR
jgi:hypothetical protein